MEQVSNEHINNLINLIEKYGINYLDDNAKEKILGELKKGNKDLALEVFTVLDKEWVRRAHEVEKIWIFEDSQAYDENGNLIRKPFYKANYMDYCLKNEHKIPTLRYVRPKYLGNSPKEQIYFCNEDIER